MCVWGGGGGGGVVLSQTTCCDTSTHEHAHTHTHTHTHTHLQWSTVVSAGQTTEWGELCVEEDLLLCVPTVYLTNPISYVPS